MIKKINMGIHIMIYLIIIIVFWSSLITGNPFYLFQLAKDIDITPYITMITGYSINNNLANIGYKEPIKVDDIKTYLSRKNQTCNIYTKPYFLGK